MAFLLLAPLPGASALQFALPGEQIRPIAALVPDVHSTLEGPQHGNRVTFTGQDGAVFEVQIPGSLAKLPNATLLALDPNAGHKIDAKLLNVEALAKSGRLSKDGTVPVIVKADTRVLLPEVLSPKTHAALGMISGRIQIGNLETLALRASVTRVFLDDVAHTMDFESFSVIRAYEVQNRTDAQGAPVLGSNVTIAIVDTGVDYSHETLGGCFGAPCKVAGGYDYVNEDADPMDDFGHGTHVADTAAGLGGVAPGATILAYKVCDAYGGCAYSWILSGIENATLAGADIISMSLGGPGTTDGVLAQAVDWAAERGVLVVSAAGNSGCESCVGEPAAAAKGLAVGATTKGDEMAYFSSRGPVYDSNGNITGIKPDVSAPGVEIVAAVPRGECYLCDASGFKSLSGTSMATPHVSGAAALLMQAHPEWSVEDVKGALMGSATQLSSWQGALNARTQGAGRIDALASLDASLSILPGNAWTGIDQAGLPVWNGQQNFTVKNIGNATQSVAFASNFRARPPVVSADGPNPNGPGIPAGVVDASTGPVKTILTSQSYDFTLTNASFASGAGVLLRAPDGGYTSLPDPYADQAHSGRSNVTYPFAYFWMNGTWSVEGDGATYAFEVVNDLDRSPAFTPANATLAPGASVNVQTTFNLARDDVADGWHEATFSAGSARAKMSFVKAAILHIEFDPSTYFALVERDGQYANSFYYPSEHVTMLASAGSYAAQAVVFGCPASAPVCADASFRFAFAGPVNLVDEATLSVLPSQSPHSHDIVLRFDDGSILENPPYCNWQGSPTGCSDFGALTFSHASTNGWFTFFPWQAGARQYIDETDWHVGRAASFERNQETYYVGNSNDGVHADIVIDTDPAAYRDQAIEYRSAEGMQPGMSIISCSALYPGYEMGIGQGRPLAEARDIMHWGIPDTSRASTLDSSVPGVPCEAFRSYYLTHAPDFTGACTFDPGCESQSSSFDIQPAGSAFVQRELLWSDVFDDANVRHNGDIVLQDGASTFVAWPLVAGHWMTLQRHSSGTNNVYFLPASGGAQERGQSYDTDLTYRLSVNGSEVSSGDLYYNYVSASWPDEGLVQLDVDMGGVMLPATAARSHYSLSWDSSFSETMYPPVVAYIRTFHNGEFGSSFDDAQGLTAQFRFDLRNAFDVSNVCVAVSTDAISVPTLCGLEPDASGLFSTSIPNLGEGDYTITVSADARDGAFHLVQTQTPTLVIGAGEPNQPPTVDIMFPAENSTVSGLVTVQGDAFDADGSISSVRVSLDGGASWNDANGTTSWDYAFDSRDHANGALRIVAKALDSSGTAAAAVRNVIVHNNHAPIVAISSPSDGDNVTGNMLVTGTATDADGDGTIGIVRVSIDAGPNATAWRIADGTTSWSIEWNTTNYPTGTFTITAQAFDGETASAETKVKAQVVRAPPTNHAPLVAIRTPQNDETVRDTLVASGWANDAEGDWTIQRVEARLNAGDWGIADGTSTWSMNMDTRGLPNGQYQLFARAYDGLAYSDESSVWFNIDNSAPTTLSVAVTSPQTGNHVKGIVAVRGTAHDPQNQLSLVEISIDNASWSAASGTSNWSFGLDTRALANGVHDIAARSAAGNQTSPIVHVWVIVDNNHAPAVNITRPNDGEAVSGQVLVLGHAEDADGSDTFARVEFSLDGGRVWRDVNGTTSWSFTFDTSGLANGPLNVMVRATDDHASSSLAVVTVKIANSPTPRADMTIETIEIVDDPIHAGPASMPAFTATHKIVRVKVTNVGTALAKNATVHAEARGQTTTSLGEAYVGQLAPGASKIIEFDWDAKLHLGDYVIGATVASTDDANPDNNEATARTSVIIGGTGPLA